jgi:ppGpp synthetase/RelA/SpoT-type nucleotidyltranferase
MATTARPSKQAVNRSGDVIREVRAALRTNDRARLDALDNREVARAVATIDLWRSLHARPLARVNANLRYWVRKGGVPVPEVSQRLKRFATIADKLDRQPGMALSRMEDIGGVRAILPSQEHVMSIVSMLDKAKRWTIRRQRFYIEGGDPGPKDDGYRAVHLIVVKDECFIEIQLRTPWQDSWAQSVEQDTRRLGAALKFGAGPDDLRAYYRLISEFVAMREAQIEADEDFMRDLAKLYAATRRYFPSPPGEN